MARASDRTWLTFGAATMLAVALSASACGAISRTFTGRRVTGTCEGACERYLECKAGSTPADQTRCLTECPQVFSDPESIGAFESLDCPDLVTFVDGNAVTRADRLDEPAAGAERSSD